MIEIEFLVSCKIVQNDQRKNEKIFFFVIFTYHSYKLIRSKSESKILLYNWLFKGKKELDETRKFEHIAMLSRSPIQINNSKINNIFILNLVFIERRYNWHRKYYFNYWIWRYYQVFYFACRFLMSDRASIVEIEFFFIYDLTEQDLS